MALTTVGFQGVVQEDGEAGRFYRVAPPFIVDNGTSHLKVTTLGGWTRQVSVAAGTAQCCGVTATESAATTLAHAANSSGTFRLDVVVMKFTWAGASSAVALEIKQGAPGSATPPSLTRTPGAVYEAPLAVVRVNNGVTSIAAGNIYDVRAFGGLGGPLRIADETYVQTVDGHAGAELVIDGVTPTRLWRKQLSGTWVLDTEVAYPWTYFDPVLRYAGGGGVAAGTVNLGAGGVRRGRYKIINGMLMGEVEIRKGTVGDYFGRGDLRIDLPPGYPPSTYFTDQWNDGNMVTAYGGAQWWGVQLLLRGGDTTAPIFAPTSVSDCRMLPWRAADSGGGAGTGIPTISGQHSSASVLCAQLYYPVGS